MKLRRNLYLDRDVCDALDALARRPGANLSAIVSDGMRAWLASQTNQKVHDQLKPRLDRMSRDMAALRSDSKDARSEAGVVLEAMLLVVQHLFAVLPRPIALTDAERRTARTQYDRFIEELGREVARGGTLIVRCDREGESQ